MFANFEVAVAELNKAFSEPLEEYRKKSNLTYKEVSLLLVEIAEMYNRKDTLEKINQQKEKEKKS